MPHIQMRSDTISTVKISVVVHNLKNSNNVSILHVTTGNFLHDGCNSFWKPEVPACSTPIFIFATAFQRDINSLKTKAHMQ